MADLKISQLPSGSSVTSSDIIPYTNVLSSVTQAIPAGNLFNNYTKIVTSVFTSMTAVWFKPANLVALQVEAWGGGGSGGAVGRLNGTASGGGGGMYINAIFTASAIPAAISITAAASVAGVSSGSSWLSGNPGNPTIFGNFFTAYGGQEGSVTAGVNAAAGPLQGVLGGSVISLAGVYGPRGLTSSVASDALYSSGSGGATVTSVFSGGRTIYGGGAGATITFTPSGGGILACKTGTPGISLFGGNGGTSSILAAGSIVGGAGIVPGGGGGGAAGSSILSGSGADGQVNLYMYLAN